MHSGLVDPQLRAPAEVCPRSSQRRSIWPIANGMWRKRTACGVTGTQKHMADGTSNELVADGFRDVTGKGRETGGVREGETGERQKPSWVRVSMGGD